ncbi:sigma-54-dependent transcriptional regulator [Archangium violaceum]|uniref:Fis family transcriptional regulator n=1 Tax=Archangium violaceum Cb vi76 TaxID=1406225 RepID=A0A084SEV8_9BACT|nr:Fis family transcriptional regulator [Archangium violaceum Cb vi76]
MDDQRNMRATTALLLRTDGYTVLEAATGDEALATLSNTRVDVMLTDLKMEPMDGLTLLKKALEVAPHLQVIMMTAFGSIETAVQAMREGAFDYVTKPFKEAELRYRVERALERAQMQTTVDLLTGEFNERHGLSALVGRSPAMRELTSRLTRVAQSDATVLVQGESGTGKELVARAVHAHSRRKDKPFVPVNCAAISETLLESELFGHAKGAFTGAVRARRGLVEEADGGTLFIDEVTETTPAFQSKLLRTLQEGEVRRVGESTSTKVDVRIVAATNRDIELEVREKRFRQDLYYRLNVVTLRVPPLRERLEDVPELVEHFLKRANARSPNPKRLSEAVVGHLTGYSFPGNVRELENLVEQAAALAEGVELLPEDFPLPPNARVEASGPVGSPQVSSPDTGMRMPTLAEAVEEAERRAIAQALERHGVDLGRVAEELSVSSTTLWRKMKRLNLRPSGADHRD